MSSRVLLLVLTVATGGPLSSVGLRAGDDRPLDLSVTPRVTHSPGTIRVTATIDRHQANRKIIIEAESPAFYRSSSRNLDGADAARKDTRVFDNLPEGTYEIRATLERNDGARLLDAVTLIVSGPLK